MNSFTFVGIGTLARNPEFAAKGEVAYVRFCLVGADYAEPDEQVGHAREVVNSVWFLAFDEIADQISTHARKGDQLIVTARIRSSVQVEGLFSLTSPGPNGLSTSIRRGCCVGLFNGITPAA